MPVNPAAPLPANDQTDMTALLLAAAVQGAGIALQPAYATARMLESGQLVALLPAFRPQALGIHAVFQSRRQMPTVLRTLLDFLALRFAVLSGR